tara:strand:+ start:3204 stop:3524 length:321 start_codon:yes stop_codon:yes gene_type:complete
MELKEAIQLLKSHNEWRREDREQIGHGLKMTDPKKLGIAIDKVVSEFENLFISGVSVMLPSYKNANTECKNRIDDIKQTSSACANTDVHLGFRLGFIECYEWIKGN